MAGASPGAFPGGTFPRMATVPAPLRQGAHAPQRKWHEMNVVVLVGTLVRNAALRRLPSGSALAQLEVRVPGPDGRAEAVPVAWFDPPATAGALGAGTAVVVTGRVRRRFFSAGGATASRTEVVADRVVPVRQGRRARAALSRARAALEAGTPGTAAQPAAAS